MQRIAALNPDTTSGKSKELFNAVQAKLGVVPNMMRTMGNSTAVLNGYLSFSGALGASAIGAELAEQIALTVANANGCEYCNAAHSYIGEKLVKLDSVTIAAAREGRAADPKADAALKFSRILLEKRGKVSNDDVTAVKEAGFSEGEITEIIAHTALNIFTNYFNNAAGVVVDFPQVALVEAAEV